jgi:hypothetical protein
VQGVIARLAGRAADALALQRQAIAAASPGRNGEWQRMRILPEIGLAQVDAGLDERALESFDEALGLLQRCRPSPRRRSPRPGSARVARCCRCRGPPRPECS